MAFVQKPGTGTLFRNPNKKIEKHPDLSGKYTHIDGTLFTISGWIKESKQPGALPYFSLAFQPDTYRSAFMPQAAHVPAPVPLPENEEKADESLPF